jgi:hypothetical protein
MADTPEGAERRYPDKYTQSFNRESLDLLLDSAKVGRPHLPTFARNLLRRVVEEGMLYGTETESSFSNLRTAKLNNGQMVFVSFGTRRHEPEGYMAVEVVNAPSSDQAILAAMTAKGAFPTDIKRLRQALRILEAPLKKTVAAHSRDAWKRLKAEGGPASPDALSFLGLHDIWSTLEYTVALLRHNKPEFDELSWEDQWALIEEACEKINEFLGSLQKLQAFLSYGVPSRKLTPSNKVPQRDVDAAVLRDVDGLTHREIGERLDISLSSDFQYRQSGHQTVRRAIERGRRILEAAFGKEGWQEQAEVMKAEKARRQSLSEEEQLQEWLAELMALASDVPLEKALIAFKAVFEEREPRRSE